MGYVGVPLALSYTAKDIKVVGFDVSPERVANLQNGQSPLKHIPADAIQDAREKSLLDVTEDFSQVASCDAIVLCVPTPLNKNREPDVGFIETACRAIGPHLREGHLVSLESTTYPGTTREIVQPLLEELSGLCAGDQFGLVYSPEREDPGNKDFGTSTIPKVVGGLSPSCIELGKLLYEEVITKVVPVSSCEAAEMTKLLENIFRSVNIALVNELKVLCHKMGIDVFEVIKAASTKPFGFMPFYPGPGLGGHCIPIDPFYLTWKAREYDMQTKFIELAGEVNTSMPRYVVERAAETLNEAGKPIKGSKVLVIGVAYKKDVDDMRESPAFPIMEMLEDRGAVLSYHDPFVPTLVHGPHCRFDMKSSDLHDNVLQDADLVIIVTNHSHIDYFRLVNKASLILDTRNAAAAYPGKKDHVFVA